MCGIVGIARLGRPPGGRRGAALDERLAVAPRPRRRGLSRPGPGRARHAAAVDHRRRRRPAADPQRGQVDVGRLQRRNLQLRRAARRPGAPRPSLLHARATPRCWCTSTRSTVTPASPGCAACSPTRCGTSGASGCSWPATVSGIKPLYYARFEGGSTSPPSCARSAACPASRGSSNEASVQRYLAYLYVPGPETIWRDVVELPPAHYLVSDGDGRRRAPVLGRAVPRREHGVRPPSGGSGSSRSSATA